MIYNISRGAFQTIWCYLFRAVQFKHCFAVVVVSYLLLGFCWWHLSKDKYNGTFSNDAAVQLRMANIILNNPFDESRHKDNTNTSIQIKTNLTDWLTAFGTAAAAAGDLSDRLKLRPNE